MTQINDRDRRAQQQLRLQPSVGDRLLGTYRDHPAAGHEQVIIGIEQFRAARELWLDRMLLQPFRGAAGANQITWRSAA